MLGTCSAPLALTLTFVRSARAYAAASKLNAAAKSEAAEYARSHDQASRDSFRGNDDVTQAGLADDIATYDRLRAENPEAQRIRGPAGTFNYSSARQLQEFAVAHTELQMSRAIDQKAGGLQAYRRALLKAMQDHSVGA